MCVCVGGGGGGGGGAAHCRPSAADLVVDCQNREVLHGFKPH